MFECYIFFILMFFKLYIDRFPHVFFLVGKGSIFFNNYMYGFNLIFLTRFVIEFIED